MSSYLLDVKKPVQLLQLLVTDLADAGTLLELAGDTSQVDSKGLGEDWRIESWPQSHSDRALKIPLTAANTATLVRSVLPRIGLAHRIYSISITRNGKALFCSYDKFAPWPELQERGPYSKAAILSSHVDPGLLIRLVDLGVIRDYQPNPYEQLPPK